MENGLGILVFIASIILMFINLGIYHKFVTKIYFDFTRGCFTELFWAWVIAMLELGLVVALFKKLFSGVIKLLGFLFKVVFIILAVAAAAFVIWKIVQAVKEKSDEHSDSDHVSDAKTQNDIDNGKPYTGEETGNTEKVQNEEHMVACSSCGNMIADGAGFCRFCGAKIEKDL